MLYLLIFRTLNLPREFIIDALSVERNHFLVRVGVVGGPSERKLPPRDLQQVSFALLHSVTLVNVRQTFARSTFTHSAGPSVFS